MLKKNFVSVMPKLREKLNNAQNQAIIIHQTLHLPD